MPKEALLYQKLDNKKVQCQLCAHSCIIGAGKKGICAVRENQKGILYSLIYGKAISEAVDPIEKKPLYHFLPGSKTLSFATVGCNFRCDNCQNWQISQAEKINGKDISPEKIIQDAVSNNCQSISYTYTEPTIFFEYALETMKLAHQQSLKNVWVTNGYTSAKARKMIIPYLDAANVDLKFFDNQKYLTHCGAKLDPILETMVDYKKNNVWLEVTTLVVPTLSDQKETFEKIAKFIYQKLGSETPWHVTGFSGEISYKLKHLPQTEVEKLQQALKIGQKTGLKHVYIGNI